MTQRRRTARRVGLALIVCAALGGIAWPVGGAGNGNARALESEVYSRLFLQALEDRDRGVRYAAAQAIEKAGGIGRESVEPLARRLRDPEWCVRMQAGRALAVCGERGAEALIRALRGEDRETAFAALAGIHLMGDDGKAVRQQAYAHRDPVVRRMACRRLARAVVAEGGEPPPEAVDTLVALLEDDDRETATEAAIDLAFLGRGEGAELLVERIAADMSWNSMRYVTALKSAGPAAGHVARTIIDLLRSSREEAKMYLFPPLSVW